MADDPTPTDTLTEAIARTLDGYGVYPFDGSYGVPRFDDLVRDLAAVVRASGTTTSDVLAADKNGEDCPQCVPGTDDLCAYHRGYDDGWAKAAASGVTPGGTTREPCGDCLAAGRRTCACGYGPVPTPDTTEADSEQWRQYDERIKRGGH